MKILMVNKYLYPRAGAETYMLYVSEQLIQAGHRISFFGMEHPENTTLAPCTTIPMLEFGRGQSPGRRGSNLVSAATQSLRRTVAKKFAQQVNEFQPDIIHAHNVYNQMSPALFIPHAKKIPVIMTSHDFKTVCPNYSLFTKGNVCTRCLTGSHMNCLRYRCCHDSLVNSALAVTSFLIHQKRKTYQRGYQTFIAPSRFMKDRLVEGGVESERIDVINNFSVAPRTITPPGSGFLFAGRLCEEKGIDTLIHAYEKLPQPRPDLTIAGTGPLEGTLRNLALKLGCRNINWTGRLPPSQIEVLLEACAVSIIPSRWFENCSIAIMESLAHGRPCIVSDSGGNPELIRDQEDGWIFPSGNAEALAECLRSARTIGESRMREMGAEAAETARRYFSPEVHLKQLMGSYESCIKQHGKS